MMQFQKLWAEKAEQTVPELFFRRVPAVDSVGFVRDAAAFQGWRVEKLAPACSLLNRPFVSGEGFTVDFGETLVGTLRLKLRSESGYADAPVRLKLLFAEYPLEIADESPFHGYLSRAWVQDEVMNIDDLPAEITLPRRYSARYLKLEIVTTPDKLIFEDISFEARSAAEALLPPKPSWSEEFAALDRVGQRTLRNCMQTVFEDGPKRDRRLWLGDFWLQAKANALTFRRFDLVEHCVYELASYLDEFHQMQSCVFERPGLRPGCTTSTYPLHFASLLLDHLHNTGRRAFVEEFYPLMKRQFEFLRPHFHDGVLELSDKTGWGFIDWCDGLDGTVAVQGAFLHGLRHAALLAKELGRDEDAVRFTEEADFLSKRAREVFFDAGKGLFLTPATKQISYASQIWMVLGKVVEGGEAKALLERLRNTPEAIQPRTPFLQHHLLEAYAESGDFAALKAHLVAYWGGMLKRGADTYWEVFDPDDEMLSPYNDARLNSACHAWSCAPTYFLRRYF